jgi:putative RNA 2'-phosphotransferase
MPNLTHISKLLSKILRHQPDLIGIQLDENGWVEVSTYYKIWKSTKPRFRLNN